MPEGLHDFSSRFRPVNAALSSPWTASREYHLRSAPSTCSPEGLLVGDAAGAVSPLTAGGLDPCLRLSDYAAAARDEALRTGKREALRDYDGGTLRRKFTGRLMMRHALAHVKHPLTASAGFEVLRTPFGRAAARKVLFRDRSFPDPPDSSSRTSNPRVGLKRVKT